METSIKKQREKFVELSWGIKWVTPRKNLRTVPGTWYAIEYVLAIVLILSLQVLGKNSRTGSNIKTAAGLPWWRSGWESACRCKGHEFELWSGKIPHAAEQLGPWATITEPARLEPVLRNKRGRDSERPAHREEEWPPLAATGESPRTETKTQHSHK